jgi:hypothetical protein
MTQTIEKRLGYLIGYLRRERLNNGDFAFKQENFIKSDLDHPFEGVLIGNKVCSLTTLSRLENGRVQHSYALLDYFLSKLGLRYKIKESLLEKENDVLNRIISGFASLTQNQVLKDIDALSAFYTINKDDILFRYNLQVVNFAKAAILNDHPQRQIYDDLVQRLELYPALLQQWLIDCGTCLKQSHPDFWDLSLDHPGFQAERIRSIHNTMLCYEEQESMVILKTLIPNLKEDSLIITKLKEHAIQIKTPLQSQTASLEYRLCLLSAHDLKVTQEGTSTLFHALKRYREAMNPQAKLILFETQLLDLLKQEPPPKVISKALSLRVLRLCKRAKSYKPLTSIVQLLNENEIEMKSLSSDF